MSSQRNHDRVYKTAQELGITEAERRTLMLARNQLLSWSKDKDYEYPYSFRKVEGNGTFKFDMGHTYRPGFDPKTGGETHCGSTGCIWGLCYVIAAAREIKAFEQSPYGHNYEICLEDVGVSQALAHLFFPHRLAPNRGGAYYAKIDTVKAAAHIERFLRTGKITDPLRS